MADGDYGEHLPSGDEDEPDEVEPLEDDEEPDEHVVGAEDGGVVNADGSTPGRYELNGVTVLFNDVQHGVDERTLDGYMTKYERASLLGSRASQIEEGSPLLVDRGDLTDALEIARKEMRERRIPINIFRYLTPTLAEEWTVNELLQRERDIMHHRAHELALGADLGREAHAHAHVSGEHTVDVTGHVRIWHAQEPQRRASVNGVALVSRLQKN